MTLRPFGEAGPEGEIKSLDAVVDSSPHEVGREERGSGPMEDWTTTRPETWASGYDRNTLAAVRMITRVLPGMRDVGWGRIVSVFSLAAWMPPAGRPDYSAAKAAMAAMGASLAKAVAGEGITVNTISPGTIRSERLEAAFRKAAADGGVAMDAPWEEVERAALPMFAAVPTGRVGTIEEIGDAIAFLASPRLATSPAWTFGSTAARGQGSSVPHAPT